MRLINRIASIFKKARLNQFPKGFNQLNIHNNKGWSSFYKNTQHDTLPKNFDHTIYIEHLKKNLKI